MARPVITPYQFNMYTSQITDIYVALEDELFKQIANRLKAPKEEGKDYVLQWQIEKMKQLRMLNQETIKALSEATGIAEEMIYDMFRDVGTKTIKSVDEEVKQVKNELPEPTELDRVLESYVRQTFRELDNFVNQTLITTNYGEGSVARMYRKIVEETTAQVLAGNKTINQAAAETVIKWADKGIDTGFVDKGGRTWQLEQYADTVLRSTINNTYNDLRTSRMQEYEIDLVLVNSYADPRPACSRIQGKVCSMSNPSSNPKYPSIYEFGYGTPSGIRGVNCRHILYPYVEGMNENNQIQYNEAEMREQYQLSQQQRYYERQVRKAKRSLALAEEIGDEVAIEKYKILLRNRQAKVREFVQEHDLARRYDKEKVITNTKTKSMEKLETKIKEERKKREKITQVRNEIKSKIATGEIPKTINPEKQARHILGDPAYEAYKEKLAAKGTYGPSYLTISAEEAQALVNKYAGTGIIELDTKLEFRNKEVITENKKIIGYYVDREGNEILTDTFDIRYSKTGVHIFPTKKE